MESKRSDIRIALPSKGRMAEETLLFLERAGLKVYKPNPRQFEATIPSMPEISVLFQRAGDIPVSVRDGSVDFGITGWDVFSERNTNGAVLALNQNLGFGQCTLNLIVPENWNDVRDVAALRARQAREGGVLRVATKFPNLTQRFLNQHGLDDIRLIHAEGTLEAAPAIGYADVVVDLVSTGTTLRDNRLVMLDDGEVLSSQACLIANIDALKQRKDVLAMARVILEFIEAHLRAKANVSVFANIRGNSPEAIAEKVQSQEVIGGLQGPTISSVLTRSSEPWFAVHIVVKRSQLPIAIAELRRIGGSGVVVTPVTYIFEEEPQTYLAMIAALEE
jgi:ATP phosphoribosyltransferase